MQLLFWMLFRSVIYCIFLELSCHQMQKHVLYLVQMCVPWHLCNCSSHEHYRIMYTSISDEMVTLNLGFRYVLRYYHAELDYLKEKIFFTFFVKFLQHMFWFLRMGGTPKSLWKIKKFIDYGNFFLAKYEEKSLFSSICLPTHYSG